MLFATIHFEQWQRQGEEGIESLKQNVCWTGVNYINYKYHFSQLGPAVTNFPQQFVAFLAVK